MSSQSFPSRTFVHMLRNSSNSIIRVFKVNSSRSTRHVTPEDHMKENNGERDG